MHHLQVLKNFRTSAKNSGHQFARINVVLSADMTCKAEGME